MPEQSIIFNSRFNFEKKMNPDQALNFIISQYKKNILIEKKRVEAMLRDLCPYKEHLQTVNLLILSLNQHIPYELSKADSPDNILELRLIKKLQDAYGIPDQLAQKTIIMWSNAIYKTARGYNNLKNINQTNSIEKVSQLLLLASQGDTYAQCQVGKLYFYGDDNIEPDFKKAVKHFQSAVQQNHAVAQNNLGCCYEYGYGVEQSYQEAINLYQLSAQQGNVLGQYNLARCYEYGVGIEQNDESAISWYVLAAEQGDAEAQYNLAWYYLDGNYIEQDPCKAVELYMLSAKQGYVLAQYNIAQCYEHGTGIDKDMIQAENWYYSASKQNDLDAKKALKRLKSTK